MCKLASLHYLLHCHAWGCCWLLQNHSWNAFCFPVQPEKGNQHQSPMDRSRRSPKWVESTRVWMERDHRTELRFSFAQALTQRRMGRTKLTGTWTKRQKGIAFPSPWKSKIPAKGQETMVEEEGIDYRQIEYLIEGCLIEGYLTEEEDTWSVRETEQFTPGQVLVSTVRSVRFPVPTQSPTFFLEGKIPLPELQKLKSQVQPNSWDALDAQSRENTQTFQVRWDSSWLTSTAIPAAHSAAALPGCCIHTNPSDFQSFSRYVKRWDCVTHSWVLTVHPYGSELHVLCVNMGHEHLMGQT